MALASIDDALRDIRAGGMVIVVDDEDRENEGDLIMAADHVSHQSINFMARYGRGLICAPLHYSYFEKFAIPLMVPSHLNDSKYETSFGVSVGARKGVTTGISAADRAQTIRVLINPGSKPEDLTMPGHIFPLKARPGGVLERRGHTEAAVDLAVLSGCSPGGVIVEVLEEDGTMARLPDLVRFGRQHGLKIISIEDLVCYRQSEGLVQPLFQHIDTAAASK